MDNRKVGRPKLADNELKKKIINNSRSITNSSININRNRTNSTKRSTI